MIPEVVLPNFDTVEANKLPDGGFMCPFCSKFMRMKNDMRRHIRTHTGEKLFGCSICGKHFVRNYDLKMHIKTKHKDEV